MGLLRPRVLILPHFKYFLPSLQALPTFSPKVK